MDDADFDGSLSLEGSVQLLLNSKFGLELGITGLNQSETDETFDNAGSYKITLNSQEWLLGGNMSFMQQDRFRLYGRAGLIMYRMDVELAESFYGIKPAGTASTDDSGTGFYLGLGSEFIIAPKFALIGELLYRNMKDVLGDSSRPFDVSSVGFGVGGRYYF